MGDRTVIFTSVTIYFANGSSQTAQLGAFTARYQRQEIRLDSESAVERIVFVGRTHGSLDGIRPRINCTYIPTSAQ